MLTPYLATMLCVVAHTGTLSVHKWPFQRRASERGLFNMSLTTTILGTNYFHLALSDR